MEGRDEVCSQTDPTGEFCVNEANMIMHPSPFGLVLGNIRQLILCPLFRMIYHGPQVIGYWDVLRHWMFATSLPTGDLLHSYGNHSRPCPFRLVMCFSE